MGWSMEIRRNGRKEIKIVIGNWVDWSQMPIWIRKGWHSQIATSKTHSDFDEMKITNLVKRMAQNLENRMEILTSILRMIKKIFPIFGHWH
jgi:hypothetical protein